ncbi:hypothetical protein SPFL3102_00934 [Sporomusaceae bacterium FL31]|nr:hypothetical protein SPFL3101_02985 [Sporomusaceae bacterium FL31]GCE33133.1 hypothetical protein SPFL3102_00934 [Sporomusaceae bacterium]
MKINEKVKGAASAAPFFVYKSSKHLANDCS